MGLLAHRAQQTSSASEATRRASACGELTDGFGVHSVLECVGLEQSMRTALNIAPPGGAVGRVGLPQEEREDVRMSVLSGGTWRSRSRASPSESAENVRIDVVLEANVGQGA